MQSQPVNSFPRRHDLDALRAIAMLLGIVLHGALSFVPNIGAGWPVQDSMTSDFFSWLNAAIHGFRMPLFFLLSGFFTAMLWRKRGLNALIKHRVNRIFLPLLVGMVTIIPATWFAIITSGIVSEIQRTHSSSDPGVTRQIDIWSAAFDGNIEAIQKHLDEGQSIDAANPRDQGRPLHAAALTGQLEAVEFMLDRGADVNSKGSNNATPLHAALLLGQHDVVRVLLEHGADPNVRDLNFATPTDVVNLDWGTTSFFTGLIGVEADKDVVLSGREKCRVLLEEAGANSSSSGGSNEALQGLYFLFMAFPIFHHLWFLWFLCWLVVAFFVYAKVMDAKGWRGVPKWMVRSPTCWLWLMPATLLAQATMGLMYPVYGPDTSVGLIPMPHLLAYYSIFFFFGAFYFDSADTGELGRWWRVTLPIAIAILFPLGYAITMNKWNLGSSLGSDGVVRAASVVLQVLYTWMMCFACMGFFRTCFSEKSDRLRYISDSSYWLYLAHLPLMMILQLVVKNWPISSGIKFALLCAVATGLLFLSYEYLVRYTFVGTFLNGPRTRPAKLLVPIE